MINTKKLDVVRDARTLAKQVYRLTTALPTAERYGLCAQMRRAAVSVGSNICEGSSRNTDRAFAAFLDIALGSAAELSFQLQLCADLELITHADLPAVALQVTILIRRLQRLLTVVRARASK